MSYIDLLAWCVDAERLGDPMHIHRLHFFPSRNHMPVIGPYPGLVPVLRNNMLTLSSLAMLVAIENIEHYLNSIHSTSSPTMSSAPAIPFSLKRGEALTLGLGLGTTALLVTIRLWTKLRLIGRILAEDCECTMRTRDRHAK